MKVIKEIAYFIIFVICIFITIDLLNKIFVPKWIHPEDNMHGYITRGYFAEEKNSLDVVFMGNSDTFRAISPMEIWNDHNITSYNYVSSGQRMWTAYYMLNEALKTQKPEVIMLNIDGIFFDNHSSMSNYRKVFDTAKMSKNKISAIMDPAFDFGIGRKISLVFPFITYHTRYNELTNEDFQYAFSDYHNPYKGLDISVDSNPFEGEYLEEGNEVFPLNDKVLKYLDMFVDKCKNENIKLEFVWLPSPDSWKVDRTNAAKEYAQKHDIKYNDLNLIYKDLGIDFEKDTADGGDHLNIYGAKKVSKYLGDYLNDNYSFKKHNKKIIKEWNKDYKDYVKAVKDYENGES